MEWHHIAFGIAVNAAVLFTIFWFAWRAPKRQSLSQMARTRMVIYTNPIKPPSP